MPLRYRLPASFAAVALLTMLFLGAILMPLLSHHYALAENSYLQAGTAQTVQALSGIDWATVAAEKGGTAGGTGGTETAAALQSVKIEALSFQSRIQVFDPKGALLVDSGPVSDIDTTGLVRARDGGGGGDGRDGSRRLPNPLGSGLFAQGETSDGSRSGRVATADLTAGGQVVAKLLLSDGPAYGAAVLRTTVIAWIVAGFAAVLLAALVGWVVSRRLTRPLLAITAASNSMARGELGVRAEVERDDEIGRLAASFNAMADTTQNTVATLQRFVADAAHELGTPLTALQADLELAQDQSDEPGLQRLVRRALRQAERIQHLSSDLLRLSRLDRGVTSMPLAPLDMAPVLHRLADDVASRAEQAGIDFTLDLLPGALPVRADAEALGTAVGNLLDNALKFTSSAGSVILGAKADDRTAVVWVEDTGIGIPAADLDGLFCRFHRGRNAAAYPGSGLGLAIVRATMELHGGAVSVRSEPSAGSRFQLTLPLI